MSSAAELGENHLDVDKDLLNKRSVEDIEWVCRSCHKYLSKNKVPPCAAVSGMQFPPKPSFFDLNELSVTNQKKSLSEEDDWSVNGHRFIG